MGAEKFLDIKCRKGELVPSAVVLVATIRALKMHGGVNKKDLQTENVDAVIEGTSNLKRHIENIQKFGLPVVVAVNHFVADTDREIEALKNECKKLNIEAITCEHWAKGGNGTIDLANKVVELADQPNNFKYIYEENIPLIDKVRNIAKEIYRADDVIADKKIMDQLTQFEEA